MVSVNRFLPELNEIKYDDSISGGASAEFCDFCTPDEISFALNDSVPGCLTGGGNRIQSLVERRGQVRVHPNGNTQVLFAFFLWSCLLLRRSWFQIGGPSLLLNHA